MFYAILIIVGLISLGGFFMSLSMYFKDKHRAEHVSKEDKSVSKISSYQLESWIDDEVAVRKLYKKPNISSDELAKELGISESKLEYAIFRSYGKSIPDYLNERRIQAACRLLRDPQNIPVEDIQKETGFGSLTAFYEVFKANMGVKPETYRRQMTKKM